MDKNKLELTWVGKDENINIEPRILIEDKELSNTSQESKTENMLIHGDNLLALKALEKDFSNRIKCVYIDPPFNTGTRINADGEDVGYDDNLEHSIWLDLMYRRLEILKNLISEDGAIFVHLDDKEAAYCKILLDEIFGRNNYVNTIVMTTNDPSGFKSTSNKVFSTSNYLLVYAKNITKLQLNKLYIEKHYDTAYSKIILNIDDNYSDWKIINLRDFVSKENGFDSYREARKIHSKEVIDIWVENYAISNPKSIIRTASISGGARKKRIDTIEKSRENRNQIFVHSNEDVKDFYILNGEQILFYKDRFKVIDGESKPSQAITDVWTDISWTGIAREGEVVFKNSKKPEYLISRILSLASEEGDFVLDSFLGSGTTISVAHKMKRKWIGIEMANHAYTHCKPRIDRVISGDDKSGVTKLYNWINGGGYRFYELAPALIKKDSLGIEVINELYNSDMLASAVALHEGYEYSPDESVFWKQSKGTEHSYLFTTTNHIDNRYLDSINSTMNNHDSLLIACTSFDQGLDTKYQNISIKKIPHMILSKCEYKDEGYPLNIINPPTFNEKENESE